MKRQETVSPECSLLQFDEQPVRLRKEGLNYQIDLSRDKDT